MNKLTGKARILPLKAKQDVSPLKPTMLLSIYAAQAKRLEAIELQTKLHKQRLAEIEATYQRELETVSVFFTRYIV